MPIRTDLGGGADPLFLGHTWIFVGTITDGTGAPQDLTGCEFVWGLKTSAQASTDLVRKTLSSGVVLGDQTVDATKGSFQITVDPDDTKDLTYPIIGSFYY